MASMERLRALWTLNLFLIKKDFPVKIQKGGTRMVGFVLSKGKLLVKSLRNLILKPKKRSMLTSYHHSYEFSCQSTPQNMEFWRGKTENRRPKFMPWLNGKAIDVVSKSIVILPREKISYSPLSRFTLSGSEFAVERYWSSIESTEEKCSEFDVDRLAEDFIEGFYAQLREQGF